MIEEFVVMVPQRYLVRCPEAQMTPFYFVFEHPSGLGRPEGRL